MPVGRTSLILVDDIYDAKADVPATFSHRLRATFGPLDPEYAAFEIDTLTLIGNYNGPMYSDGPVAGPRKDQLPLTASVVAFPEKP